MLLMLILEVVAAPVGSGDSGYALPVALVWAALGLAMGAWAQRARDRYVRLYREARGEQLPTPEELLSESLANYPRLSTYLFTFQWRLLRILREQQPEPEVERARRRAARAYMLSLAVVSLFLPVVMVAALL